VLVEPVITAIVQERLGVTEAIIFAALLCKRCTLKVLVSLLNSSILLQSDAVITGEFCPSASPNCLRFADIHHTFRPVLDLFSSGAFR
jgi:hypothetical protein